MKGGERKTREVWKYVNDKRIPISRASVINFLATLAEEGLVTFTEQPGKGGYHRIYTLVDLTMTAFNNSVIDKFLYKLWEVFPENTRMGQILKLR